MELFMEIIKISGALLYLIIGIVAGYQSAYRIIRLRKQKKQQFFYGVLTLPISLPVWLTSLIVMLAFSRGKKLESENLV